jgi:predicted RNase H-like nuclease
MSRYLGVDLAWGARNRTGFAVLDRTGCLVHSCSVRSDDELDDVIAEWGEDGFGAPVVAIDASLIVVNETGSRPCEKELNVDYRAFRAGAYPSNLRLAHIADLRGARLAERSGWNADPTTPPGDDTAVCIEVYPHPAMVSVFSLSRVLEYKRRGATRSRPARTLETRRSAFGLLVEHYERVLGKLLRLSDNARWRALRRVIATATKAAELNLIEDELDAILCAYVAWLWHWERAALKVYGDFAQGYIVAPPPPSVVAGSAVRPACSASVR